MVVGCGWCWLVPPAGFEPATPALGAEYGPFSGVLGWVLAWVIACCCWGLAGDRLGRRVPQMRHAGLRSDPNERVWKVPRRRRTRKLAQRVVDTATRPRWAVVLRGSQPGAPRLGPPSSSAPESRPHDLVAVVGSECDSRLEPMVSGQDSAGAGTDSSGQRPCPPCSGPWRCAGPGCSAKRDHVAAVVRSKFSALRWVMLIACLAKGARKTQLDTAPGHVGPGRRRSRHAGRET